VSVGPLGIEGAVGLQHRLLGYVRGARVHPALLFTGPDRETKWRTGRALAQAMLCRDPAPSRPFCGQCSACLRVAKDSHPDVIAFRAEGEDTLRIESVRELCAEMEIGPLEGPLKICLVDECHRMNTSSANAFLKTLEEPGPGRLFWLFTTRPGLVIPTVISRCLSFAFPPVSAAAGASPWEAPVAAALASRDFGPLVKALDDRQTCNGLLGYVQGQLRDVAVGDAAPARATAVLPAVSKLSPLTALRLFDESLELEGRLRSNANGALMLEMFLRQIA